MDDHWSSLRLFGRYYRWLTLEHTCTFQNVNYIFRGWSIQFSPPRPWILTPPLNSGSNPNFRFKFKRVELGCFSSSSSLGFKHNRIRHHPWPRHRLPSSSIPVNENRGITSLFHREVTNSYFSSIPSWNCFFWSVKRISDDPLYFLSESKKRKSKHNYNRRDDKHYVFEHFKDDSGVVGLIRWFLTYCHFAHNSYFMAH